MKNFPQTLLLTIFCFTKLVGGEEPMLVRAVVRELTIDPNSPPLEMGNSSEKQSPWWVAKLEILQVLRGDPKFKGQAIITATADSQPEGNGRFVTPRLNDGDVGIWAIKHLEDGSWTQVYSPYEVEKGIRLPLIKGRHDEYEGLLTRLSSNDTKLVPPAKIPEQEETAIISRAPNHPTDGQLPDIENASKIGSQPVSTKGSSSPSLLLILGLIVIAIVLAGWWLRGQK